MLLSAELVVRLIPNTAPIALVQSLAIRAFQQRHAVLWEKLQPPMTDAAVNAINAIPVRRPVLTTVTALSGVTDPKITSAAAPAGFAKLSLSVRKPNFWQRLRNHCEKQS